MARFSEQKINLSSINGGVKYENGDVVFADAINAPIEASAYAQKVADEAKSKAEQALSYVGQTYSPLSAYPVGSIYISVSSTSPASLFGGSWTRIQDRFLLAAGTKYAAGNTDGSETHTHELSNAYAKIYLGNLKLYGDNVYGIGSSNNNTVTQWNTTRATRGTADGSMQLDYNYQDDNIQSGTRLGGSTDKGNNMPPYLTVYMWKRTA